MMGGRGGYDADIDFDWDEGPCDDDDYLEPMTRNDRYGNAYGNYSGGYSPPRRFDGPRGFSPRGPLLPPMRFPPGPPMPLPPPAPFISGSNDWNSPGRGFDPEGPPPRRHPHVDTVIRYLMRCGIPKQQCKNLPRDLLELLEPNFCGLCGMSFNAFSMSRVHYISKNHMKNQNKFLMHRRSSPSEMPLKSRDLYCELCDVHITSKSHAESHYAGRSHRSVVEGRRPPKNPFLINKEDRVRQLIRREKKNLKPVEEKIEETEIEPPKPTDPDLYCDICKTTVTCSDQMTAHLNGKRHLIKEKRHILDMMKGGNSTATNANDNGGDKDETKNDEGNGPEGNDFGEGETGGDNENTEW